MKILKCDKCGCHVPEKKILENIHKLRREGHISREVKLEAEQELREGNPYIECHNPECNGILRLVDENPPKADFKQNSKHQRGVR